MKHLAIGLWMAQVLAAITMLIATGFEIRTIVWTGPLLTVIGLLLGLTTRALQSKSTLAFALSGPLVCALISLLILAFRWSPEAAYLPTLSLLTIYAILIAPLAIRTRQQIRRWQTVTGEGLTTALQFRLKTLFVVMTAIGIMIAAAKFLFAHATGGERPFFAGYTLVVVLLSGLVVGRYLAYPRRH